MQPEFSKSTGRVFADFATCGALALTIYHERMLSPAGSPARTSATTGGALESLTALDQDFGLSFGESFASYDPATSSWKTSQHSFIEELTRFSGTWPRSGFMQSGIAYRLPTPRRRRMHADDATPAALAGG